MPPPADLSELPRTELEARVLELLGKVSELTGLVAALREENARLKGLNGRPSIKRSGMENATEPPRWGKRGKHRGRGKIATGGGRDQVIRVQPPPGSRFKGYEPFLVQDLVLRSRRSATGVSDGSRRRNAGGALACRLSGHFGPELRRFVLMQYHQGQVTVERLVAQLRAAWVGISSVR